VVRPHRTHAVPSLLLVLVRPHAEAPSRRWKYFGALYACRLSAAPVRCCIGRPTWILPQTPEKNAGPGFPGQQTLRHKLTGLLPQLPTHEWAAADRRHHCLLARLLPSSIEREERSWIRQFRFAAYAANSSEASRRAATAAVWSAMRITATRIGTRWISRMPGQGIGWRR
jgi:hypothetical protein